MRRLRIWCLKRIARRELLHYADVLDSYSCGTALCEQMMPSLVRCRRRGKAAAIRAMRMEGVPCRHLMGGRA